MQVSPLAQRYGLTFAICCGGIIFAWITSEPSCLLAAVAAISIYGGRWPGLLSIGICSLAFVSFFLLPGADVPVEPKAYLRFAAFVPSALLISLLIQDFSSAASSHRAERETRLIVESMPGLGWSTDPNGNFKYVNPSVVEYLGPPSEDLDRIEGSDTFGWEKVVHPDDVHHAVKRWLHCLQTGESYHSVHRVRRFDGTYRWFRAVGQPSRDHNGRVTGWYGTTIDIEHQMKAEEGLRKSEQQLRLLIDTIPAFVWCATTDGEPSYFNKRLIDYLGIGLESFDDSEGSSRQSAAMRAIIHPDELAVLRQRWSHSVETGESFAMRHRLRRADGEYRWVDARADPLRDEDGHIVQWYGVNVDVDDRQKAEEALRRSEQQFRLLIDTIPALVWCATPEGEPSYINKRLMEHVGLTLEDLEAPDGTKLTGAIQAVVYPDHAPALQKNLTHSFRTGEPFLMKYRMRRADGVYRWVDGRADPLRDDNGRIVQWYGVCVDIDDETRMQDALRSAQDRLSRATQAASLAELSASIAHEVNQPLAAVVTNSNACRHWLSADPPNIQRARITAERIVRDANSVAEVVRRIRALFKQTAPTRTSVDLNKVVAEVCQLLADDVTTKNIIIETHLDADLPSTLVDRVQVQQVLVNLLRNGIDAMDSMVDGPKLLTIRSRRHGMNMVVIEVCDRGSGVEDRERIFEPFFTTKTNGMGMGLAICRSIVESHDGQLWVGKNNPRGTVFSFTLPTGSGNSR